MTVEEITKRVFNLDEITARHDEQIKTCFNRIAEAKSIVESVHKLTTTVELLARAQQETNSKMDKLTVDIEDIKRRPSKRWDSVVTVTITALITALVTFAFAELGLR